MKTQSLKLRFTAVFSLLIGMLTYSGGQIVKDAGKAIENTGEGMRNAAD